MIVLTQGKVALVDDEDYAWLSQWKWFATKQENKTRTTWYAARWTSRKTLGGRKMVQMHRQIAAKVGFAWVDHRDGNGLNDQRENVRPATPSQNHHNRCKRIGCSSRFKGVSWDKARNKRHASICVYGRVLNLGRFEREEDAARAYDQAAVRYFGEFALTNKSLGLL